MQQPTMFAHDFTTIFYPTAPGRVYKIAVQALYDSNGSDEDYADSTTDGDLADIILAAQSRSLNSCEQPPPRWPFTPVEVNGKFDGYVTGQERAEEFADALEQWADWCDRDRARLDSLDGVMAAVAAA